MGCSVIFVTPSGEQLQVGRGMSRAWHVEYNRILQKYFPTNARGNPKWQRKNHRQHRRHPYRALRLQYERKQKLHCTFYTWEAFLQAHLPIWQEPEGKGYTPSPDTPFDHIEVWW